jgi:hypothetical protein
MEENWQHKIHMWVVGFQNLPYVGQNTNATIENYHGTLKAQLKSGKSRLVGCQRCLHSLLVSKSMQKLWVCEQKTPTIVCGWGLVGGTVDS